MSDYLVIFVTTPDLGMAETIARTLVDENLAACVNVVPSIRSFYRWEGKVQQAGEALLVIKTTAPLFPRVESRVKALHSYETPEMLAVPVIRGSESYLGWIDSVVLKG